MVGKNRPSILVIMAALNEEEGIGPTIAEIKDYLDSPFCLVIDGHSEDSTVKIAEAMGAKVIPQRGRGKGDAIATAITHSKSLNIEYAALIDADFTYPAEYLPSMVELLEKDPETGMVCGNRFNGGSDAGAMNSMFDSGNRLLAITHSLMNGIGLYDPLTGLRVIRWNTLREWKPRSKGFDIEIELNCYIDKRGYKIAEMPIRYRARLGEKKLKMRHGFTVLRRIMIESLVYLAEIESKH
jgi:glycosyltransferase involved in cell wall biosynthesis